MKTICSLLMMIVVFVPCANSHAQIDAIKSFTEPYRTIDLAAGEMGTVFEVLVAEGSYVRSGEILARLDEQVLEASKAIAADSKQATGKLNSALAELKMQTEKFKKINGLFARGHASQIELDRAKGQLEIADAQVESVKDELRIRKLELKRIEAQIEQRRIRTPIDGIVTRVLKDEGEFVSAADPTVATVVQLDPLLVIFQVPYEKASQLITGQELAIQMGAKRTKALGRIEYVAPTTDAQSGTRRVKIMVANSELQWESGGVCYLDANLIRSIPSQSKFTSRSKKASGPANSPMH
ncbi:MAG: efflux RND transporter periplasmic adaptor subunit [Planctomycetota bacterium]